MKLVVKDTHDEAIIGETYNGFVLEFFEPPHKPSSSGKCYTDQGEYYVGVLGLEWIEREDQLPLQSAITYKMIHNILFSMKEALVGLGHPDCRIDLELHTSTRPRLFIAGCEDGTFPSGEHYQLFYADDETEQSLTAVFENAWNVINNLPSVEERALRVYRNKLAALIDFAQDANLASEYYNPLRNAMTVVNKNLLSAD